MLRTQYVLVLVMILFIVALEVTIYLSKKYDPCAKLESRFDIANKLYALTILAGISAFIVMIVNILMEVLK